MSAIIGWSIVRLGFQSCGTALDDPPMADNTFLYPMCLICHRNEKENLIPKKLAPTQLICSLSGLGASLKINRCILSTISPTSSVRTGNIQSYNAALPIWRHRGGSDQMPFPRLISLIHCHPIQFTPTTLFLSWILTSGMLNFFLR
jgi:hypothetical protein